MIRSLSIAALIVLAGARPGVAQALDDRDRAPVVAPAPASATPAPDRTGAERDSTDPERKPGDPKVAGPKGADKKADDAAPAAAQAAEERDDAVLDRAQPDFTIVNLPTSLRLPKFKSAFRVTHRFTRPLGQGDFGNLLEDFFGFDSGALIGLEYRFGIMPGAQVGILRTSDRTIQFFGQYSIRPQSETFPIGLAAHVSVDGTNNFRDSRSPAIGLIVSRSFGSRVAAYAEPIWVNNTNPLPSALVDSNSTMIVGLGARARVGRTTYLVGEIVPRVSGYDPGSTAASFGIEKRVGGHAFQMNFSNSFGTTIGQVARGGLGSDNWYIGFNISRKFF